MHRSGLRGGHHAPRGTRMVHKSGRRTKALEYGDPGKVSTRFSVEFVCIKRRVSEELVAADWSTAEGEAAADR
jgi:hypothetical protein